LNTIRKVFNAGKSDEGEEEEEEEE